MLPNFVNIRHFSHEDGGQWGDASKIDHRLLVKMDLLVDLVGSKGIVTSGFRPNDHGSQHALGLACDLMFPTSTLSLYEIYQKAESLGFKGLGVYPDWKYTGKAIGGIHVDEREGHAARWMGVQDHSTHTQVYIALNNENLKKHGVIV